MDTVDIEKIYNHDVVGVLDMPSNGQKLSVKMGEMNLSVFVLC